MGRFSGSETIRPSPHPPPPPTEANNIARSLRRNKNSWTLFLDYASHKILNRRLSPLSLNRMATNRIYIILLLLSLIAFRMYGSVRSIFGGESIANILTPTTHFIG